MNYVHQGTTREHVAKIVSARPEEEPENCRQDERVAACAPIVDLAYPTRWVDGKKGYCETKISAAARGKISDPSQKLFSEAFNLSGLVWGLLVVREGLAKKERSVRPQAET